MRWRFPTLLLVYVTLDFANPLMPGAVSFAGGSIEVVQGDRTTRAVRTAAPARLVATPPTSSVVAVDRAGPVRRARRLALPEARL
jgi:hypothetical protein